MILWVDNGLTRQLAHFPSHGDFIQLAQLGFQLRDCLLVILEGLLEGLTLGLHGLLEGLVLGQNELLQLMKFIISLRVLVLVQRRLRFGRLLVIGLRWLLIWGLPLVESGRWLMGLWSVAISICLKWWLRLKLVLDGCLVRMRSREVGGLSRSLLSPPIEIGVIYPVWIIGVREWIIVGLGEPLGCLDLLQYEKW